MTAPDLDEFGICDGISETIVTTMKGWSPNAAPIGIIRKGDRIFIRLFKGSTTYHNVQSEGFLVANVVNDPVILVRSTFSNLNQADFNFANVGGREVPILNKALSWVVFEYLDMKVTEETLVAELKLIHAHVNRCTVKAPNRGYNAVLEAAVHATRYRISGDEKYLKLIRAYSAIVSKCGGEQEKNAISILHEYMDK
ncbi:MAG: DUF447 family protein [Methanosarcinaceae archaeon]|nr:DUF447 family protein [Methanosarcinaceae archaeon]MDF1533828.1 DUF447 family protein [Methanosarcinaceae archaeon]